MAMMKSLIFDYKLKEFKEVSHPADFKSEDICLLLCKENHILPTVRILFQLRICDTDHWVPPNESLRPNKKYEFRIRFRIPELIQLKKLSETTYDYLYHQVRYDLIMGKISEIQYPVHENRVLGICLVDAYIDMTEKQLSINDIKKNYKKYIPKDLFKIHQILLKKPFLEKLKGVKEKFSRHDDLFYIKGQCLDSIFDMAPNYLIEQYEARANYLQEDMFKNRGKCPVLVEFNPHHETEPGLRVFYKYKTKWHHIVKIDQIYTISKSYSLLQQQDSIIVKLEVVDLPNGFILEFVNPFDCDSFITCLAGYYRLMIRWNMDLCLDFKTPSLAEIMSNEFKCHGPVGGDFAYNKIKEVEKKGKKGEGTGTYIIRQCEKEYDTYYIDINMRKGWIETMKITREDKNKFALHLQDGCVKIFDKLTDLALSIDTNSDKLRIPPSEYDQTPTLLICLPKSQIKVKKPVNENTKEELQRKRVQIFDPEKDLCIYESTAKECEGGMIVMRADWTLVNQNLNVTLKCLKSEKHVIEFMKLANNWGKMYSHEFLKLYGITLSPYAMVMEYSRFGPLDNFLRNKNTNIPIVCLLNTVNMLVRAVMYLQENGFFHGFIRCANLHVIKYDSKNNDLVVKLSDPGFPKKYTKKDLPWIPLEFHNDLEKAKTDYTSEAWAFATTLWEIFSYGTPIDIFETNILQKNLRETGSILPLPESCPEDMKITIMDGYSSEPDERFNMQHIFARLSVIKESLANDYDRISIADSTSLDRTSLASEGSRTTDHTMITDHDFDGSERSLNYSEYSTNCDYAPLINKTGARSRHDSQNGFANQANGFLNGSAETNVATTTASLFGGIRTKIPLPDGSVVEKLEKIGEGHYGTVHLGYLHDSNNKSVQKVAIKRLKPNIHRHLTTDFKREISIMKSLEHPNIVKILKWTEKSIPISIIMEYVECGSFNIYLSSRKPNLTNEKLLNFALDIANGMAYLREKKIIHRDLAARNILVDNDRVKISDFGLAQYADSDGYYFVKSNREIPIMWYAPESIRTNKFSFQSDVWSYGVTLFEMFSRGEKPTLIPNIELGQEEFLTKLEQGHRLRKPNICPDSVYEQLMRPCWEDNPKERPTFIKLIETIKRLQQYEKGEVLHSYSNSF